MFQVSGITLPHVKKFKCLGVVFTSDTRWNEKVDTRICRVVQFCVCFIALW